MAVTESFLVNTNSFNAIIEALIELDEAPEEITDELLISLGFDSPSELLVVHMLKELDMVTVEGEPTELYHKMTNPDTTDEAIATGLIHAYIDLFENNHDFHKLQKEDIHNELNNYFEGRKTDLIIKYMTNTLHKLITYAGLNNVQKAVDSYFKVQSQPAEDDSGKDIVLDEEPALSENNSQDEENQEESEKAKGQDNEFDDVFFSEEENENKNEVGEEETVADLEEDTLDIISEDDDHEEGNTEENINFDELPQVKQEEKGSKNIFDFFGGIKKKRMKSLKQLLKRLHPRKISMKSLKAMRSMPIQRKKLSCMMKSLNIKMK